MKTYSENIVDEYWSHDKNKHARIFTSNFYPSSFKLVLTNIEHDKEFFKFHRELSVAQDEAEDFCLDA